MKTHPFLARIKSRLAGLLGGAALIFTPQLARAVDALPSDLMNVDFHLTAKPWAPLAISTNAYLTRVEGICRYFKTTHNTTTGVIIDPYANADEAATRYYAYAVAALVSQGKATDLLSSGSLAMTYACAHMGDTGSLSGVEFYLPVLS